MNKPETSVIQIEEEFTIARLFVSKMKSEIKNLVNKSSQLEQLQNDQQSKLEDMDKELSNTRLIVSKYPVLNCIIYVYPNLN
jgi:kinesin family protein 5